MNNGVVVNPSTDLFQKYLAKIKGDAGLYKVYGVNILTHELYILRACGYEWVPFSKVRNMTAVDTYNSFEIEGV